MGTRRAAAVLAVALAVALAPLAPLATAGAATAAPVAESDDDRLYLVVLRGPGTAGLPAGALDVVTALRLRSAQDAVLAEVGRPEPTYRWTTALNGVAVPLSPAQAADLARNPAVALVEKDGVRRLSGAAGRGGAIPGLPTRTSGGAGVVIGVVDSGLAPEASVFSGVADLGRPARDFRGECVSGDGWAAEDCSEKVVGARWFVDGFGDERIRSGESLSARDQDGHGTQVASVAAGNAGITARVGSQRFGTYAGVAPQARLAVYKACWTAPDPTDDGCSTADLVSAVDSATADGVDVLNLSVGGPAELDSLDRALLGAAESGIVVVAAAGNGAARTAGHPSPWVTTVGAAAGPIREGQARLRGGPTLAGAMAAARAVGPARLVVGSEVAADGAAPGAARVCTPGSLDAARVGGRVVLCERGTIGRVDKSAAVALADGVGMILVNTSPGSVVADFHSVPTVHLPHDAAGQVRRWAAAHPQARVRLVPLGAERPARRVAGWSSSGDPAGPVLKPDLVAVGSGVLGAVPGGWDLAAGTSVAAATTSGAAALLRSRHPGWSEAAVRSALVTTTHELPGEPVLEAGSGRVVPDANARVGLTYDIGPADYRAWLSASLGRDLNTPSVLLSRTTDSAERTVTNVSGRTVTFTARTRGFEHHDVLVSPASVRLAPGRSATFTVTVGRTAVPQPDDDGWVTWRGQTGTATRTPVLISR